MNTQSKNQYPNNKAQTSDENQLLGTFENSGVNFDDRLLSKEASIFHLFLQEGGTIKKIYTTYLQAIFTCQKYISKKL